MKKALITGITGQDGSYLAEFLIEKGYEVHGVVRRVSSHNQRWRIDHLLKNEFSTGYTGEHSGKLILHHGDLTDSSSVEKVISEVCPDEIYNLGAQSHVGISFDIPENTVNIDALGTLRLLEGVRKFCPNARVYQASSSEMFGKSIEIPQTEKTPFYPRSPYACSKVFAYNISVNYRDSYGLHVSNGILFNHESERRGENFVTRKITRNLTRIKIGLQKNFSLGNLNAERDWGHAKDYIRAMWMMLQQNEPDDYVIGTGEKHSVREFLEECAKCLNMNIHSNGEKGLNEKYVDEKGEVIVNIHPRYFRPTEVDSLLADSTKAQIKLGWEPKLKFKEIVRIMTEYDLETAKKELYLKERGDNKNREILTSNLNLNEQDIRYIYNILEEFKKGKNERLRPSPAEIIDRMSIVKLKIEKIGKPSLQNELETLQQALREFKEQGVMIRDEWIDELYYINKKEWALLDEINKLREWGENFAEIGKKYIEIESINKKRAEEKNRIIEETGIGFKEIKKDHPSA